MTESITSAPRPMPAVGKWRRAGLVQTGWQILVVEVYEQHGVETWLEVEHALQILKPLRVASLRLSDGTTAVCPADRESGYEFFTRTPAEQRRAAEVADRAHV